MRRNLLTLALLLPASAAFAQPVPPEALRQLPTRVPHAIDAYGPGPLQRGELRLPAGAGPFPVAVVVHGGCYTAGFETLRGTSAVASALAERGIASWNVEYRQVGDPGGGWPGTFEDLATAADHLRALAARFPLDLSRVALVGHSAGGHAAAWLAARSTAKAPAFAAGGAPVPARFLAVIDGPVDLAPLVGPDEQICGRPVVVPLLGGTAEAVPDRYRETSVPARLPLGMPQLLVAADVLPAPAAEAYAAAARSAGDTVEVMAVNDQGHFGMLVPGRPAWRAIEDRIARALGQP